MNSLKKLSVAVLKDHNQCTASTLCRSVIVHIFLCVYIYIKVIYTHMSHSIMIGHQWHFLQLYLYPLSLPLTFQSGKDNEAWSELEARQSSAYDFPIVEVIEEKKRLLVLNALIQSHFFKFWISCFGQRLRSRGGLQNIAADSNSNIMAAFSFLIAKSG